MKQDKEKKKQRVVQKYNMDNVEDIWSSVLADESSDDVEEQFEGENLLYNDIYFDDVVENNQAFAPVDEHLAGDDTLYDESFSDGTVADEQAPEETVHGSHEADEIATVLEFAAVLEFVGGMRQEVARARLFEPQENSVLLLDEETNDEMVVFFEQLACIQISGLPPGASAKQKEASVQEIIETVEGNTYHVLVAPQQNLGGLLFCFTPEEQTRFPVTLFPRSNIRKRCQDKLLTDILLEKRFVSRSMLERALQDFAQMKSMTLEKIIAQKARVPLAEIEEAIDNAKQNQMLGLQAGEILLLSGLVHEDLILEALEYHEQIKNLEIGEFLIDKGVVKEMEVYISLAEMHRIPFVDLRQRKIPKESLAILPEALIVHHEVLPLVKKDDILLVASHCVDPAHLSETILKASGCKQVKYVLSPPTHIRKIINVLYDKRK